MNMPTKNVATRRLILGLTGGLGSGKSAALAEFRRMGVPTADADAVVHRLMAPGGAAVRPILKWVGPAARRPDGSLDRAVLAARAFRGDGFRRRLEKILHPLVRRELEAFLRGHPTGLVVLEVPLLFEAGWDRWVDQTAVVWAPRATRLRRLIAGRGFTRADALRRLGAQMPLLDKRRQADHVLDNAGAPVVLRAAVRRLVKKLQP
jgi:dephospho-CoA kinase